MSESLFSIPASPSIREPNTSHACASINHSLLMLAHDANTRAPSVKMKVMLCIITLDSFRFSSPVDSPPPAPVRSAAKCVGDSRIKSNVASGIAN